MNLKHFSVHFRCKYNYNSYEMNNDKQGYKINIKYLQNIHTINIFFDNSVMVSSMNLNVLVP